MKRGKYEEFQVNEGYIKNVHTGKNMGQHIDLFCYTADENNIYYEVPHIDYPDNYVHIKENEEIPVRNYFEEKGCYNNFYAIISGHKKIVSIENFKIEECNTFYSIKITKDIASFISEIGFDKFILKEKLFNWWLNELPEPVSESELLFFIDSNDSIVQEFLNKKRRLTLKNKMDLKIKDKIESGYLFYINNNPFYFTYKDEDQYFIKDAILKNASMFINNNTEIDTSLEIIKMIFEELEKRKKYWQAYKTAYLLYIFKIITDDFNLDMLNPLENFLVFGYTNDFIIKKMEERLNDLLQ